MIEMPHELDAISDHYESTLREVVGKGETLEEAIGGALSELDNIRKRERYDGFLTEGIFLSKDDKTYYLHYTARFARYIVTRKKPVEVVTIIPLIFNGNGRKC